MIVCSEQHTMLFGGSTQCRTKNEDGRQNDTHYSFMCYAELRNNIILFVYLSRNYDFAEMF